MQCACFVNTFQVENLDSRQMLYITELKNLEKNVKEAEERAKAVERQLVESEGSNMELSEKVTWLEEQLEKAKSQTTITGSFEETLYAKEQCIQRLEAELKMMHGQIETLKIKKKRKLKKLQIQLIEAKQEAAVTAMEFKEQLQRLQEEQATRGKPQEEQPSSKSSSRSPERDQEADSRVCLIVELSNQVSQQQERINHLEKALEEKETKIKGLEAELQLFSLVGAKASEENKNLRLTSPRQPENGSSVLDDVYQHDKSHLPVDNTTSLLCGPLDNTTPLNTGRPPSGRTTRHNLAMRHEAVQGNNLKLSNTSAQKNVIPELNGTDGHQRSCSSRASIGR
uniref:Coiled-coil domain containing 192 n=1 Tax=Latimeria chalumnae TaxID=7897 RepID=M3XKV4_LATCH